MLSTGQGHQAGQHKNRNLAFFLPLKDITKNGATISLTYGVEGFAPKRHLVKEDDSKVGAEDKLIDMTVAIDKLDKIGLDLVKKEMLQKGISAIAITKIEPILNMEGDAVKKLATMRSVLADSEVGLEGVNEVQTVINKVLNLGLESADLDFDLTLARGLNYYTGSIFEVKSLDVNIGSIAGGGRYDDLTSIFGLKDVSGVGISFGIDRIYLVMEELGLFPTDIDTSSKVLFLNFGEIEANYCFKYLKELRENNISSELYPNNDKIKKQMNYANNKGVQFVVMIGEDEMKSGQLTTKNMSTGEQKVLSISEFIKIFL